MPIPWVTVLQAVPWSEVIRNAPKVAEGAKKLWNTVGKKQVEPAVTEASENLVVSPERKMDELQARVETLEETVEDLHGQMLAASQLIKELAEQNTQLIRRIESNRVHMFWLAVTTTLVAVAAVLGLVLVFSQGDV
jgi:tetrahydromethanopterin S-methyltransferase subunit B